MTRTDDSPPEFWIELPGTAPAGARPRAPETPAASNPEASREQPEEACYVISIAARMVGMHAQTLRGYERAGLLSPARSGGNIRLYRRSDIDRLRLIQRLMAEHGVNLAGVDVILRLEERIRSLRGRVASLEGEVHRLRQAAEAREK